jgi:subtilisin family serine protease
VLSVPDGRSVAEVIEALNRDSRVDLAQRMNLFTTQTTKYDDPYLELQSAATEMEVEQAHELATGRGVSIAIIDSAIDGNHPDLRGRVRLARNLVTEHPTARGARSTARRRRRHRLGRQQSRGHHRRRSRRQHRGFARAGPSAKTAPRPSARASRWRAPSSSRSACSPTS